MAPDLLKHFILIAAVAAIIFAPTLSKPIRKNKKSTDLCKDLDPIKTKLEIILSFYKTAKYKLWMRSYTAVNKICLKGNCPRDEDLPENQLEFYKKYNNTVLDNNKMWKVLNKFHHGLAIFVENYKELITSDDNNKRKKILKYFSREASHLDVEVTNPLGLKRRSDVTIKRRMLRESVAITKGWDIIQSFEIFLKEWFLIIENLKNGCREKK